jgi:hypothetical protein
LNDGSRWWNTAPVGLRKKSLETRSKLRIVHRAVDVKSWAKQPPSVETARPSRCPCCGAAGRPEGSARVIVGHGLRERLVYGPLGADDGSAIRSLLGRRYRCLRCRAVLLVLPRCIGRRLVYTLYSIVLALASWAVDAKPLRLVRAVVSPFRVVGAAAAVGWSSVKRWVRHAGRIFDGAPPLVEGTWRQRARRLLAFIAAFAPRTTGNLKLDALQGAMHFGAC